MDAQETIGALRAKGLSQRAIAQRTGLSQGAISHIETGRRKDIKSSTEKALTALWEDVKNLPPTTTAVAA